MEIGEMTMKLPKIEINGKIYEMQEPRAKMWRIFAEFDSKKKDLLATEFLDKHCEILAQVFPPLSAEDLLNGLEMSAVLPLYRECYVCLSELMLSKMNQMTKNSDGGESAGE